MHNKGFKQFYNQLIIFPFRDLFLFLDLLSFLFVLLKMVS